MPPEPAGTPLATSATIGLKGASAHSGCGTKQNVKDQACWSLTTTTRDHQVAVVVEDVQRARIYVAPDSTRLGAATSLIFTPSRAGDRLGREEREEPVAR